MAHPKHQPLNISSIRVSGAFRIVRSKGSYRLEVYNSKDEAVSAGVSEKIAAEVFSDVRVAWCYADLTSVKGLVRCRKRSLDGETCEGECKLYGDGVFIEEKTHVVKPGVTYRCKCSSN